MNKLLLLLLSFLPLIMSSQSADLKQKFAEYTEKGYYKIDGKNIVVSAIIDSVPGTQDEIYDNVLTFFARTYRDTNSGIQTSDKAAGTVIGKGYYRQIYVARILGILCSYLSAYHILRVDVKDGRMRAICTADQWEEYYRDQKLNEVADIVDFAPITDRRFYEKGKQMEAFINLVDRMHATINELEKTVKVGGVAAESEDW